MRITIQENTTGYGNSEVVDFLLYSAFEMSGLWRLMIHVDYYDDGCWEMKIADRHPAATSEDYLGNVVVLIENDVLTPSDNA